MKNKINLIVFIILVSQEYLFSEALDFIKSDPVKIEYYGYEYHHPPIMIYLKKNSKLFDEIKSLIDKDGWFIFYLPGAVTPDIKVYGENNVFSMSINTNLIAISYTTKNGSSGSRIKKISADTYTDISNEILKLIKEKKTTGKTHADCVIIPLPQKPYSPKNLDEAYLDEIKSSDMIQLLDSKKSNVEKMKVIESILDRVKKNPTCPKLIKKEIEEKGEEFKQKELKKCVELNNKMTKKEKEQAIEFLRKE